jgi:CBS domain containing-hemolysin-like protein
MIWLILLVIIAVGLFFSGLFSGAETGFYCVSRLRLHLGTRQNDHRAVRLSRILQDRQAAVGMTLVGTNLMNYITTAATAVLLAKVLSEPDTEVYTVLVLTPIVFVFGEVVPKTLFQRYAYALLTRCSALIAPAYQLMRVSGILWCHRMLTGLVTWLTGADPMQRGTFDPKRRMATLLQEALAGQRLGDDRSYLVEQVMQLSETPLHAVMVPRNRALTIAAGADKRELMRAARRTTDAHLPVYDTNPRHIVGTVAIDDLLRSKEWKSVGEHLDPVMTVSPHVTVATAMDRMQGTGCDMVIVTDRGGQMLGVATLRDLLDTVLGELGEGFD